MENKKNIYALCALVFISGGIGAVLQRGGIAEFLFWFSIPLLIVLILLLFFRESVFQSWKKFALIYIPISIILVFLAPEYADSGFGGVRYALDKERATWLLGGIFLITSIFIIIRKHFKTKE